MKLTNYQCYVHRLGEDVHVDVELFIDDRAPITMCDCSAYMGGVESFGNVESIAAEVREDLSNFIGTDVIVKRDSLDGSIDIFRAVDNVLLFSMECDHLRGADWVPIYNSQEA